MCELLVRIKDKTSDDPRKDAQLTKRGDVICVQPDGWPWGKEEVSAAFWRIVKIPGVSVGDFAHLLSEQLPQSQKPDEMLRRRAFRLDLDAIDAAHFADDGAKKAAATLDALGVLSASVEKARLHDPDKVGDTPAAIG